MLIQKLRRNLQFVPAALQFLHSNNLSQRVVIKNINLMLCKVSVYSLGCGERCGSVMIGRV